LPAAESIRDGAPAGGSLSVRRPARSPLRRFADGREPDADVADLGAAHTVVRRLRDALRDAE
jgi:uncharacterized protein YbjT (DUF2867 family)